MEASKVLSARRDKLCKRYLKTTNNHVKVQESPILTKIIDSRVKENRQTKVTNMKVDIQCTSATGSEQENYTDDPCGSCDKIIKEEDVSIKCDGTCTRWHHKGCSRLSSGEVDILRRKSCKVLWLCDICKLELLQNKKELQTT